MDTSDTQKNPENPEEKLSKLKNEVHTICEQLSFLGEESMFLSVKLKDASPFFSGSRLGQAFLFEKSEVIGMFYNYCKLSYSSHELAAEEKTESGSDSSATDESCYNYDNSNVYKDVSIEFMPSNSNKEIKIDKKEKYMQYKARKRKSKQAKEKDVELNAIENMHESDKDSEKSCDTLHKRYRTRLKTNQIESLSSMQSLEASKTEKRCKYSLRNKCRKSAVVCSEQLSEDMTDSGSESFHVKEMTKEKSKRSPFVHSEQSSGDESMHVPKDQTKSPLGTLSKQSTDQQIEQSSAESSSLENQTESLSGSPSTQSTGYQSSFQSYLAYKNRESENTKTDKQKISTEKSGFSVYNESTSEYSGESGSDTEEDNNCSVKNSETSFVTKAASKSNSDSTAMETCIQTSAQRQKEDISKKKTRKSKDDSRIEIQNKRAQRRKKTFLSNETSKSKDDQEKDTRHGKGLSLEFRKKYKLRSPNVCVSPVQRTNNILGILRRSTCSLLKNKEKSKSDKINLATPTMLNKRSEERVISVSEEEYNKNVSRDFKQSLGLIAKKIVSDSGSNNCDSLRKQPVHNEGARNIEESMQPVSQGMTDNIDQSVSNLNRVDRVADSNDKSKDNSHENSTLSSMVYTNRSDIICISDSDKEDEEEEDVQITKVVVSPYLEFQSMIVRQQLANISSSHTRADSNGINSETLTQPVMAVHQNLNNMTIGPNVTIPDVQERGCPLLVSNNQNVAIMSQKTTENICSLVTLNSQNVTAVTSANPENVCLHSLSKSQNATDLRSTNSENVCMQSLPNSENETTENPQCISHSAGFASQEIITLDSPDTENAFRSNLLNSNYIIAVDQSDVDNECQASVSSKSASNMSSQNKEIACQSNSVRSSIPPNTEIMCQAGYSNSVIPQNTENMCQPNSSETEKLQTAEKVCRPSSPKYQKCTSSNTVHANVTSQSSSHERQRFTITVDIEQDKIDHSNESKTDTSYLKENLKECSVVLNNISSGTSKLDFTCKYCRKWFDNIDVVRRHEQTCNSSGIAGFDFSCKVCTKTFENLNILRKHEETCEMYPGGKRPYECEYCGIRVFNYKCLKIHLKYHK